MFLSVPGPHSVAYVNLETSVVAGGRDGGAAAKGLSSNESSHYDWLWPCWYSVCSHPRGPGARGGDDRAPNRASDVDER